MSIPAFPIVAHKEVLSQGMTLRDYFAAAALTGLLASGQYSSMCDYDAIKDSYRYADYMLIGREDIPTAVSE